jgi:hypothetical protein
VTAELAVLGVVSLFPVWVVLFGGAARLEDALASAFVVHPSAPWWSASMIRWYVGLSWAGGLLSWLL